MRIALVLFALSLTSIAVGQENPRKKAAAKRAPNPSLVKVEDVPGLPRVLLIGDSISMGYTVATRELLKGIANVHRIPANGGPTTNGLKSIDSWLGDQKWDVIHFNWGLHDLKYIDDQANRVDPKVGKVQVALDDYEKNLRTLTQRLKKTGAKLIWCSTTPVPEGAEARIANDELKYNAIAAKIMEEEGVAIDDLYSFAKPQFDKIGLPANVHYSPEGYSVLATQVAKSIREALSEK